GRAVRPVPCWSGDHDDDSTSFLPPGPAAPRSGEGPGHLPSPLVAADQGRAYPLRPRRRWQAANRAVPPGRLASLADPPGGHGEGGRTMPPVETLLAKLPGAKRAGNGWSARCPAHDDRRASLSVSEGDDGTALVKCHAGCDTSAILAAIGMKLADL